MLSDEEKEEYIEHEILDRLYCLEENDFDKNKVDDGYIKAVLNACKEAKNLIEKQSKEIEELKRENKEIYQTGYVNGCVSKVYEINKKWEDKIKAKIEEVKEEKEHYLEINDEYNAQICDCIIEEYESLLEKE